MTVWYPAYVTFLHFRSYFTDWTGLYQVLKQLVNTSASTSILQFNQSQLTSTSSALSDVFNH